MADSHRTVNVASMRDHWWWRPGWRPGRRLYTWHVTFADVPVVQELAASAQARLAGLDGIDLVPGRWLHLTTQDVGFTDEISDADLAAIGGAASARLAAIEPIPVTIGPARVASEGILCWVGPDNALTPMRDAIRVAIADVWGPQRVPDGPAWAPHVSIAYGSADGPADAFEAALDGEDTVAAMTVDAVTLIRLGRDQHVYEWETLARVPLGTAL
jgi:2'-5' RNA ligase